MLRSRGSAEGVWVNRNSQVIEFNSLRGLAALVVILYHSTLVFRVPHAVLNGAAPFLNAQSAVVLFFVLSGFVLALSWLRFAPTIISYGRYLVRRAARIYPAIWMATAIGVALLFAASRIADPSQFTPWMLKYILLPNPLQVLLGLMGIDNTVLMPLWTIYVELAGSAAVPLLCWLVGRGSLAALSTIVVLAVVSVAAMSFPKVLLPLEYLVFFAMGVALAMRPLPEVTSSAASRIGLAVGVFLVSFGPALFVAATTGEFKPAYYFYRAPFASLIEGVGAVTLMFFIAHGRIDSHWLRAPLLQRLGERSYSLYLVHAPLLIVFAACLSRSGLGPIASAALLAVCTVTSAWFASGLIFRVAEMPGMRWGKALTRRDNRIITLPGAADTSTGEAVADRGA